MVFNFNGPIDFILNSQVCCGAENVQGSNPRLCRGEAMNDRPNSFSLLGYFCSVDF